jgi:hypothetical protein
VAHLKRVLACVGCLLLAAPLPAAEPAAGAGDSAHALAVEDLNPLTRMYVMRFEDNVQFGFGPDNEPLNFFRIQPLFPIDLGARWTLLTRVLLPLAHAPWPETVDGLGDVNLTSFVTPARAERFVWGVGPSLVLPTGSHDQITSNKWSAGPAMAAVYNSRRWQVGLVVQNLWSFAGDGSRPEVNVMAMRPAISYHLDNGWYLSTSPSILADWAADDDRNRWLLPVGGGVGKILVIGGQRISALVEAYQHVLSPEIGPDWQLRLQVSLLYPK